MANDTKLQALLTLLKGTKPHMEPRDLIGVLEEFGDRLKALESKTGRKV